MARKIYRIDRFAGIDQSVGENGLDPAFSPDACNMDTSNGDLAVAKGYIRYISAQIPGDDPIYRMTVFHTATGDQVIVATGSALYAYKNGAWGLIYTFTGGINVGRFDFTEAQIGNAGYLIIGTGEQQLVKYDGSTATLFGSAEGISDKPVRHVAMYRGRLFCAGEAANPARLYWSQLPGSGRSIEAWGEVSGSANVSGGYSEVGSAADPIVGLAALSSQLVIFKKRSIYRLLGDKPSNFTIERVDADAEEAAYTSIVTVGDGLYFMTGGGLHRFNGVSASALPDARKIADTLSAATTANTRGAAVRNKLYFSITESDMDAMIEYDLLRGTYMLRRGFAISDIAAWNGRLFLVNSARYVYAFDEGISYDGTEIQAWWQTPVTDLFDKGGVKAMRSLYFRGSAAGSAALIARVSVGESSYSHRILLPAEETEVIEAPLKNEGRTFSLRLANEAGGRWRLTGGLELAFETWRRVE